MRKSVKTQLFRGSHAGPDVMYVHGVFDGPGRLAYVADWGAAYRFCIRRGEYANHGADWNSGVGGDRQRY